MFAKRIHYTGAILHFIYALCLLTYIKIVFVYRQPVEADGMYPVKLMKNNDQDYKRFTDQYELDPDERYVDKRIYPDAPPYQLVLQAVCLLYPLVYELAQLSKKGFVSYFANNSTDYVHIVAGYSSIYCQLYVGTWSIISKLVMMFVVWATMMKTIE